MDTTYILLADVAEKLGMHINTIRNAVRNGELEAFVLGELKTTPEAVQKYIESKRYQPRKKQQ